jgi:hypothetical protein
VNRLPPSQAPRPEGAEGPGLDGVGPVVLPPVWATTSLPRPPTLTTPGVTAPEGCGLGGDLMGQRADLKLVVAEEVGVVGGGEVGGEFADFGVDGLADVLGELSDVGLFLEGGLRGT